MVVKQMLNTLTYGVMIKQRRIYACFMLCQFKFYHSSTE